MMKVTDFKNNLWDYTRKIGENTNIVITSLCEHHGLTVLQVRILVEIQQHGSHTIGSLASRLNIAGTNISTMCKKLATKGFLERVRDDEDERVVKLILSEKGNKVVEEINQELIEKISISIKGETDESLYEIINGLKKMNDLLEKISRI
jgi:MarR family transcriptional regulator, organic hydroperoxide resistance regulator